MLLGAERWWCSPCFVLVEWRTPEPMVDLWLLRSPGYVAATLGALVVGVGIIGMSSNLPFLVQVGLGGSLWVAVWLVVGWSATSVLTSLLVRRVRIPLSGPHLISVALVVVGVGQLLALGVGTGSSPWRLLPSMVVAGLATGVLNAVLGREAVANVPAGPCGDGQRLEQHRPLPRRRLRHHRVLGGAEPRRPGHRPPPRWWTAGPYAVLSRSAVSLLGAVVIWRSRHIARAGVSRQGM